MDEKSPYSIPKDTPFTSPRRKWILFSPLSLKSDLAYVRLWPNADMSVIDPKRTIVMKSKKWAY